MTQALPCGHDTGELLALLTDPDTADPALADHVSGCVHCAAALADLRAQWQPVRDEAQRPVPVPRQLVRRVLSTLDELRERPDAQPLVYSEPDGVLVIAERTVLRLAGQIATETMTRLAGTQLRGVGADDNGLLLRISIQYGQSIADVSAVLRDQVGTALQAFVGTTPAVTIQVEDVTLS